MRHRRNPRRTRGAGADVSPAARASTVPDMRTGSTGTRRPSELGELALVGWRKRVGEPIADVVSDHTPLSAQQARGLLGALFFVLSVYYVAATLRRALDLSRRAARTGSRSRAARGGRS